jgi:hypothetical protein
MRGFLKKNRPKGLRLLWQKRYFILDHDFLRYYDPAEVQQVLRQRALSVPKTARVAPKGELPLRAIGAVVRETETEFTIQMQSGDFEAEREPYKLSAGSTVRPSVLCVCHPPPAPAPAPQHWHTVPQSSPMQAKLPSLPSSSSSDVSTSRRRSRRGWRPYTAPRRTRRSSSGSQRGRGRR